MRDLLKEIGARELTPDEQAVVDEFERNMRDEVIPQIERDMYEREVAWRKYVNS